MVRVWTTNLNDGWRRHVQYSDTKSAGLSTKSGDKRGRRILNRELFSTSDRRIISKTEFIKIAAVDK